MSHNVSKFIDTISRLITPLGVVFILILQSQFVSRKEFEISSDKITGRIEKIEQLLIRMESGAEIDKRHDNLLLDHEQRIRSLERLK
jgi:hypothetical protein